MPSGVGGNFTPISAKPRRHLPNSVNGSAASFPRSLPASLKNTNPSRSDIMRYIVSYDVVDTAVRNRLSRILEEFGERVQFSVFECELSPDQYSNLISKLKTASLLKDVKGCKISFYKVEPRLVKKIRRVGSRPVIDREVMIF